MFDLVNDPLEVHNIHDEPAAVPIRAELRAELARLEAKLGDAPYIGAR